MCSSPSQNVWTDGECRLKNGKRLVLRHILLLPQKPWFMRRRSHAEYELLLRQEFLVGEYPLLAEVRQLLEAFKHK